MSSPESPHWPMVKNLRPCLRRHVKAYPQDYRGERWYVLRDEANGHHLRFNRRAYEFIGRLDSDLTVEQARQQASLSLGEDSLSQDEVIQLLTHLFASESLRSGIPVAAKEFFNRYKNDSSQRKKRALMNPLSIRIPLLDPDRFLNQTLSWVRPVFSRAAAFVFCFVVGLASLLVLANFSDIISAVNSDILRPHNLVILGLLFPIIKTCHEFGHAYAVKLWGGEVHEMGITVLVLMPIPYVDASAAWTFRERRKRVLVGAMGILVEIFLAALALMVWFTVEPGLVKDAAFNLFLIGSVSTVLFNANPLLKFDGYFILQDLIEIPNLASRASRYYRYLLQHYLFGLRHVRSPVACSGERRWFISYALLAFFYRFFVLAILVLFLAQEYLFIGVALATWAIFLQILLPLFKGIVYLLVGHQVIGHRPRATLVTTVLIVSTACFLFFYRLPLTTSAQGIVWLPDQAQLYVATEGFVSEVLVQSGEPLQSGQLVMRMRSPELDKRMAVLEAEYKIIVIRQSVARLEDLVQAGIYAEEKALIESKLKSLREQYAELDVYSGASGVFVTPNQKPLKGSYLRQGELIGYVVNSRRLIVQAVVPHSDIGLLRENTQKVSLRLAERPENVIGSKIIHETPGGSMQLPSVALGVTGGGSVAVKATDGDGLATTEKVFRVDLALPESHKVSGLGERVYIRFDHGKQSLAHQWLRSARQLLLSRLSW
jgi:putative peptide zinc metalloprotease protein